MRTGAYLSPHLVSFTERIRVDGADLDASALAQAARRAAGAAATLNRTLPDGEVVTQFEALTAIAYDELAREAVDVAVVEAGLGGRYDATNVIPSEVQVLTNVSLEHTILKASMVISGKDCPKQASVEQVADQTVRVLKRAVPAALPGVVFLSGGQSDEAATAHLGAMAAMPGLPWPLTYSYSRALQNSALKTWSGKAANIAAAQKAFYHRARMNSLASQGKYGPDMEKQA